jgi:hypothetical protein
MAQNRFSDPSQLELFGEPFRADDSGPGGRRASDGGLAPKEDEARLRLIGELLCKGILCSRALGPQSDSDGEAASLLAGAPEERVLDYLRRHQPASPAEIRSVLNLSRSSAYRVLQRLLLTGQVVSNGGRTSAAAYRLVDPSRN